jgi:hypothetical protein
VRQSRFTVFAVLVACAIGCHRADRGARWKLKPPAPDAAPVAATKQLAGIYPVGSLITDRDAPGGFGPCDNYPMDLAGKDWGTAGTISLVAFPDESVAYFKNRGIALRLVNRTRDVAGFGACDSCLGIVREALAADGRWRAVESRQEAICGNSFHRVFLEPDQYWEFPARVYQGALKTRIRFRLEPGAGVAPIFSNEFEGEIAPAQFAVPGANK